MTSELMTRMSDPTGSPDEVAFVGRVVLPEGDQWCAVTHHELSRAADIAADLLARLELRPGAVICVVSRHSAAAQYAPLELAAQRMGLISCHVEATRFDAHRLALYFEHLPIKLVVGLTEEVVDNLGVELRQLVEQGTLVMATEPLVDRLRGGGLTALAMTTVGPALALECLQRDGLHLDESLWTFVTREGRIFGMPNDSSAESEVDTGVLGTLVDGLCGCGTVGRRLCP